MNVRDIILIILILILVGVTVFIDTPAVRGILQTRKSIDTQKEILADTQLFLARVRELTKIYSENKENIDKIDFIFPPKEDVPNLIVQVESLVIGEGLMLDKLEITPQTEEESTGIRPVSAAGAGDEEAVSAGPLRKTTLEKKYKTLMINLGFTGSYPAFKNFLNATQENMRLIDIESINISPGSKTGEGGTAGVFTFDLILKTYYQK